MSSLSGCCCTKQHTLKLELKCHQTSRLMKRTWMKYHLLVAIVWNPLVRGKPHQVCTFWISLMCQQSDHSIVKSNRWDRLHNVGLLHWKTAKFPHPLVFTLEQQPDTLHMAPSLPRVQPTTQKWTEFLSPFGIITAMMRHTVWCPGPHHWLAAMLLRLVPSHVTVLRKALSTSWMVTNIALLLFGNVPSCVPLWQDHHGVLANAKDVSWPTLLSMITGSFVKTRVLTNVGLGTENNTNKPEFSWKISRTLFATISMHSVCTIMLGNTILCVWHLFLKSSFRSAVSVPGLSIHGYSCVLLILIPVSQEDLKGLRTYWAPWTKYSNTTTSTHHRQSAYSFITESQICTTRQHQLNGLSFSWGGGSGVQ